MEFSIKLAGWVLDNPVFHPKKKMVSKHFIFPKMHFKANLFFPIMTPFTYPTTQPRDYQGGESKKGE